jgi:hypothetical protein
LTHEIVIATANDKNIVMSRTGIAHNICHVNGVPITALMMKNTIKVGKNLKTAITTAEIGSIIRGNAVLRIKRCPAVTDFTPPVRLFATK